MSITSNSLVSIVNGTGVNDIFGTISITTLNAGTFVIKSKVQLRSTGNGCNNKLATYGISVGNLNTNILTDSEFKISVLKNKYFVGSTETVYYAATPGTYEFNLIINFYSNNACSIENRVITGHFIEDFI
jgi:hypothetical protein